MTARAAPPDSRRRRLERRALPVVLVALAAFTGGALLGAAHVPSEQRTVERFAEAWRRADYAAMRGELVPAVQRELDAAALAAAYRASAATATVRSYTIGRPVATGDGYELPVRARTIAFGDVAGTVALELDGDGERARIRWAPHLTFPGVPEGSTLERTTALPPRAALLARDNLPLAAGPSRTSEHHAEIAPSIVGELGPIPSEAAAEYARLGYPPDARVGISGLERIFERQLAGTPGGELRAGGRLLASGPPREAPALRTTLAPSVQAAAVAALGGRLGGAVAMVPDTGEILAAAGIAFSGLQPPGSTFKLITLAGALQHGLATPRTTYPPATATTLSGVELGNANGELCGGTLVESFAHSCNSVFAPLGAELGAQRLVATAERFGFNEPSPIPGGATSTIPLPEELGEDDLILGSTAIGQGRVLATALQMTTVAAAIALEGRMPRPTLVYRGERLDVGPPAVPRRVARQIRRMMVEVVRNGTGGNAALPGVRVAGKTGTAELRTTQGCTADPEDPESCPDPGDTTDTTAWFVAFAPAEEPQIAAGVMLVEAGAGGDTAAPGARLMLDAALRRAPA